MAVTVPIIIPTLIIIIRITVKIKVVINCYRTNVTTIITVTVIV
jgi:hypothetical protein